MAMRDGFIFVQFKNGLPKVIGTASEPMPGEMADFNFPPETLSVIRWRQEQGAILGDLLKSHGLGWCSGGGTGFGRIDIDLNLHDWSRLDEAIQVIIGDLTDRELIGWATIVTSVDGVQTVRYPSERSAAEGGENED